MVVGVGFLAAELRPRADKHAPPPSHAQAMPVALLAIPFPPELPTRRVRLPYVATAHALPMASATISADAGTMAALLAAARLHSAALVANCPDPLSAVVLADPLNDAALLTT